MTAVQILDAIRDVQDAIERVLDGRLVGGDPASIEKRADLYERDIDVARVAEELPDLGRDVISAALEALSRRDLIVRSVGCIDDYQAFIEKDDEL